MKTFTIVWAGQLVSLLGSAMTGFALTIWAWQFTRSATPLALVSFFSFAPTILVGPLAGALVDRWNRKLVMMFSDLASGLATIAILLLYATGQLQVWHFYVAGAFAGTFGTFQWPAYSAAMTLVLRKDQYARASGMISLAGSASAILGPLLAGVLIGVIGTVGIMIIDVITFVIAISTLLFVHIPQPAPTEEGRQAQGNLWQESLYGFRYILARPSLLGFLSIFVAGNLVANLGGTVSAPMILARSGNNAAILGSLESVGAIGGLIGGFLLSTWGGPRRKIHGVLMGWTFSSLLGRLLMGLGRGLPVWSVAVVTTPVADTLVFASSQAIWQAKVAPDVQGRVFSVRRTVAESSTPIAILLAGPLADYIFEPALAPGGGLASAFGWLVGNGAGAGMALMMIASGVLGALIGLGAYALPAVRNIEDILPDHAAQAAN